MASIDAGWPYPALAHLDGRLVEAIDAVDRVNGGFGPFRGLVVDRAEVQRLLAHERAAPLLTSEPVDSAPSLGELARLFGLDRFECDVVLLALAVELDTAYERLFAYLHDDVSRRRPSVGLALDLFCSTPAERIAARRAFAGDAPLLRQRVIELGEDRGSLLRAPLALDEQIVRLLLGIGGLDRRLRDTCALSEPARRWDAVPLTAKTCGGIAVLGAQTGARLYLRGAPGLGQLEAAEALAAEAGAPLLTVAAEADAQLAAREAMLHGAVLLAAERPDPQAFCAWPGAVVIATGLAAAPPGFVEIALGTPDASIRRGCWQRALDLAGLAPDEGVLDALATRFRLAPAQIASAVATAESEARWRRAAEPKAPVLANVFAAARAQTGAELASLATKIALVHEWHDLVLPAGAVVQLGELCDRVAHREHVLSEWGFDGRLALGKGVTALFTGASGTGKTMAAGVVARRLELDAYRINLAGIVSPYVGETEQNLDRVFAAATATNAILFFDEADALFGKRSEVRDARDRYSNIEISYLLQRMEEFDGVSILASNFQRNIDDAFLRRLDFTVHFPFPVVEDRRRIWSGIWPTATPLSSTVDFDGLAERFSLSGGEIRNAALAAAYAAAADGGVVTQDHLLHGVRRELNKIGRTLADEELVG